MDRVTWLTETCEMLNSQYAACDPMGTNYRKFINENHIGGYRIGFHFYGGDNGKTKTLSRNDFYQVFSNLDNLLKNHREINVVLEAKINKDYAFIDVALTSQLQ